MPKNAKSRKILATPLSALYIKAVRKLSKEPGLSKTTEKTITFPYTAKLVLKNFDELKRKAHYTVELKAEMLGGESSMLLIKVAERSDMLGL